VGERSFGSFDLQPFYSNHQVGKDHLSIRPTSTHKHRSSASVSGFISTAAIHIQHGLLPYSTVDGHFTKEADGKAHHDDAKHEEEQAATEQSEHLHKRHTNP